MSEESAYKYACEVRASGGAISRVARFREAVGFAKGLLGADVDDVLQSSRLKGVCDGSCKPCASKKAPLSVAQLECLERMACEDPSQRALFAGCLCFITHGRLRFGDGQHLDHKSACKVSRGSYLRA